MLKSTQNPISKEQFTKLRDARNLIKEQFDEDFSLQADDVIQELYAFAVRSEGNELFRLFTNLNATAQNPVQNPLNEEQFILLREAGRHVEQEFDRLLLLTDVHVLDELYALALQSNREELYDIFLYLRSREGQRRSRATSGSHFKMLRRAGLLIESQFGETVVLHADNVLEKLGGFAARSSDQNLLDTVSWLEQWQPETLGDTELMFEELSAADFERLREAKIEIQEEFGESLSLHSATGLEDLYDFALRSSSDKLFELFRDLLGPQMNQRRGGNQHTWFSREQYMLLRSAREAIKAEFDAVLELQSVTVEAELFQYALHAEEEDLFDLCWEYQHLEPRGENGMQLPSKEEFRMLRGARTLIQAEFKEDFQLQSSAVEYDLYRYAVRSEADDLFELFTQLMSLPDKSKANMPKDAPPLLSRDEYVALRKARRLILAEFGEQLPLDQNDVLDRVYAFALESEGVELFDIHAELHAWATAPPEPPAETENKVVEEEVKPPETEPEAKAAPTPLQKLMRRWKKRPPETQHTEDTDTNPPATEPAAVTSRAQPTEAAEEGVVKEQAANARFADLVVRAVEQSQGSSNDAASKHPDARPARSQGRPPRGRRNRAHNAASSNATRQDRSRTSYPQVREVTLPPTHEERPEQTPSNDNPVKDWYVGTLDDRLRVRLSRRLSVGPEGELMVAAPESAPASAVIELVTDKPVIFARNDKLYVNDQAVARKRELAEGDKIAIAGTVLQITQDYAGPIDSQVPADTEESSA